MRKLKRRVDLVTQNAWDSETLTMPLALGYLKSYAEADSAIRAANGHPHLQLLAPRFRLAHGRRVAPGAG